jgi:hypothetical protein
MRTSNTMSLFAAGLAVALAGCTPQITSGDYNCGPNASCPSGEVCNIDTTCVTTGTQQPFACDPSTLHEPQDTPAQAFALAVDDCVSAAVVDDGCLQEAEAANWVSFQTPANCTAVAVKASLVFPVSFEPLVMTLTDSTGATVLGTGTTCTQSPTAQPSDAFSCLLATLVDNTAYAIEVTPAGGGNCGGDCKFNDYTLTVQFVTP